MQRAGWDLQGTACGDGYWRATFYVTGMAHSIVGGSAWEQTPWQAVQRAAGGPVVVSPSGSSGSSSAAAHPPPGVLSPGIGLSGTADHAADGSGPAPGVDRFPHHAIEGFVQRTRLEVCVPADSDHGNPNVDRHAPGHPMPTGARNSPSVGRGRQTRTRIWLKIDDRPGAQTQHPPASPPDQAPPPLTPPGRSRRMSGQITCQNRADRSLVNNTMRMSTRAMREGEAR